ncbi:VPLPA-CTERM sorting domain-containing protein [Roseitranquillus sediminis]|uniref:VPLPA-CTERM sorting domain-containing protein n=1 Tax=Roseitranquillus sediminis TaxID=2809051 RepID=UPI001D0C285B|nr:VPLPA-CTERM sorting domain-containing protein [Roseitranquillus sediminis]MBM9595575.1 VPLPA-CTERM sorting domain-containing protein [Roseitranquillus sediminis]
MLNIKKLVTAAALAVLPGMASAAILDFTAAGSLTGTFQGVGYTVTGSPRAANQRQNFDGDASLVLAPLALEKDGIGVGDDEISFGEIVTITFDRTVTIRDIYFLDLFESPSTREEEVAIVTGDDVPGVLTFGAFERYPGTGYAEASLAGGLRGSVFTFTSSFTNDSVGRPDYALAGLNLAPIPLPAGGLLLVSGLALAGGIARRRKA